MPKKRRMFAAVEKISEPKAPVRKGCHTIKGTRPFPILPLFSWGAKKANSSRVVDQRHCYSFVAGGIFPLEEI